MVTSPIGLCRSCRLAMPAHAAATAGFSTQEGEIPLETDCLLEGDGFELPVPRENGYRSESSGFVYLPETVRVSSKDLPTSGTEVSNPLPLQQRVERTTIAWSPP